MSTIADFHLHGFDVSSYQPAGPDFGAGGRAFGIFKATEGTGYFDGHFAANRSAAHAQGMAAVGIYHFARSSGHSAQAEAQWFLDHVGKPQPGEFAVLDYEEQGVPWKPDWIAAWGRAVQAGGWKTVLYTYLGMLGSFDRGAFPDLWIAAYGSRVPGVPWTFWQHTDGQGSVAGNDGPWDCSVFHTNDIGELRAWAGAGPAPSPEEDDVPQPIPIPVDATKATVLLIPQGAKTVLMASDNAPAKGATVRVAIGTDDRKENNWKGNVGLGPDKEWVWLAPHGQPFPIPPGAELVAVINKGPNGAGLIFA